MMNKTAIRLSLKTGFVILVCAFLGSSAFAVPSDREAWSSLEHGITIYKDAVDDDIYWCIPKIRFETKDGKTLLRPRTLLTGEVEYTTRIIPYFPKDLRELVAQNIPNIRQASQLKPVVAKSIGIDLPHFGYKFKSPDVTNYQYLDVPRLVKFTLSADEAAQFDELYSDDSGVNVDFTLAYDGMMTDKFYNLNVSCKQMERELVTNFKPTAGLGTKLKGINVYLGADLEFAFTNSVQNSLNGVNIISKGDLPGMQEMLRRVMNLCFEPATRYYRTEDEEISEEDETLDPNFMSGARLTGSERMKAIHDALLLDKGEFSLQGEPGEGLLPPNQLKAHYLFKKTSRETNNQAVVRNVSMKDTTSTAVIAGFLAMKVTSIEKLKVIPLAEKKISVGVKHAAAAALSTGIIVRGGEQYTINAEFSFRAISGYSTWGLKQYSWDAAWENTDADLYFRVGNGQWTPVNRRAIIESDVTGGGGELQFYMDRGAIFNKIPEKLRKGNLLVKPVFTLEKFAPNFTVQISGRRSTVQ